MGILDEKHDDSRLKGIFKRVTHPTLPLERTYCAECGGFKGWVTTESADFIRAANVLVYCDRCVEKLQAKLGPVPLKEVAIPEVYGISSEFIAEPVPTPVVDGKPALERLPWIENCADCKKPMLKLKPVPVGRYRPRLDTIKGTPDGNQREGIDRQKTLKSPEWYCQHCKSLWGSLGMFWVKFEANK